MPVIVDELITRIRVGGVEQLRGARAEMGRALDTWGQVASVIAVGAAAIAGGTLAFSAFADAQIKDARAAGTTVETYTGIVEALSYTGIEAAKARPMLARYLKTLADGADGVATARDALAEAGFTGERLAQALKDPAAAFPDLLDGLRAIDSEARRSAAAAAIFGDRNGPRLASAIAQGGAAMVEAMKQAQRFGVVLDTETAESAERLNDSMDRIRARARGVGYAFFAELVPPMERMSEAAETWLDTRLDRWLDIAAAAGRRFGNAIDGANTPVGKIGAALVAGGVLRSLRGLAGTLAASEGPAGRLALMLPGLVRGVMGFGLAGASTIAPWVVAALVIDDVAGSLNGEKGLTSSLLDATGHSEEFRKSGHTLGAVWSSVADLFWLGTEGLERFPDALAAASAAVREYLPDIEDAAAALARIPGLSRTGLPAGVSLAGRGIRQITDAERWEEVIGEIPAAVDAYTIPMGRTAGMISGAVERRRALMAGATEAEAMRAGQLAAVTRFAESRGVNIEKLEINGADDPAAVAREVRREIERMADEAAQL